ncbi:MAG: neutral zinc metallopeptidase [Rhodothermales bacterium]
MALLVSLLLGQDPTVLLQQIAEGNAESSTQQATPGAQDEVADFTTVVLGYTEDVWSAIFSASGSRYPAPRLVMYDAQSVCGYSTAATAVLLPGRPEGLSGSELPAQLQRLARRGISPSPT